MDFMKTMFLNPPSYEDFDGGAGSRYQATREVWSFWYPTWLAYPAGMIPGARLLDAPPHNYTVQQTVDEAKNYDLVVIHTSTPSLRMDARTAESIKAANPNCIIAFVGGHPTARPEEVLKISERHRYRGAQGIRSFDGRGRARNGLGRDRRHQLSARRIDSS